MAGMLKQNKASMRKALAGQSYVPCRSAGDNLTHPQEFHFATDKRLGPINNAQCNEETENNFVGSLRQHPPSPVSVRTGKIIYNYFPKGGGVVDIYRDAKRQGIYPLLFTDPEGIVVLVLTKSDG